MMLGRALCDLYRLPESLIFDIASLTGLAGLPKAGFTHDNADLWGSRGYQELRADKSVFHGKKVLFLIRDPKDILVSCYFHATRRIDAYDGSISDFVRDTRFGICKVLAFHNIWYANRHVPGEFSLVRYEDMHRLPDMAFRHALEFIGVRQIDDDVFNRAVQHASFESMQRMERDQVVPSTILRPALVSDAESYKVRRGRIGGHRDYLGHEDIRYIDAAVAELGYPFG